MTGAPARVRKNRGCARCRQRKSSTRPLIATSASRGTSRGPNRASKDTHHVASPTPTTPPTSDNARLSVSSCDTMRRRPAPKAARTANSLARRAPRTSSSMATLPQPMSRTRPTTPPATRAAAARHSPEIHATGPRSHASPYSSRRSPDQAVRRLPSGVRSPARATRLAAVARSRPNTGWPASSHRHCLRTSSRILGHLGKRNCREARRPPIAVSHRSAPHGRGYSDRSRTGDARAPQSGALRAACLEIFLR